MTWRNGVPIMGHILLTGSVAAADQYFSAWGVDAFIIEHVCPFICGCLPGAHPWQGSFAVCYLVTGILASIASYKIHPALVAVGASGAIFGMYGIFIAFLLTGAFTPGMKKAFLASILIFIGYNLIMGPLRQCRQCRAHRRAGLGICGRAAVEREGEEGTGRN
jgi:hypothetical protein